MQIGPRRAKIAAKAFSGVLAALFVVAGCRGDMNAAIQQGNKADKANAVAKTLMADGRYTEAKLKFEEVLFEIDGTNAEARFGKVLSELLQFVSIVRVISQLTGDDDTAAADENEFLHALIDDLVGDLIRRFDAIAYDLKRLKADPVFKFVLDNSTPVYLTSTDHASLDLKGEWNRGEVFLLDVIVQALLGVLNFVQAHDLRADYLGIFNKFTELDLDLDIDTDSLESVLASVEKEMPKILNLLAFILNENPRLLDLDPDTGVAQLSKAGLHFGNAVDNLRKALFFTAYDVLRDPDQSDDAIAFLGDGNGKLIPIDDEADLCAVRDSGDANAIRAHTYKFQLNFLFIDDDEDGIEDADAASEKELETSPDTGCLVAKLMDMLLPPDDPRIEKPGVRINLIQDVVPVVLNLVGSSDAVDFDVAAIFGGDVIKSFIGDAIEFDLGPLFHSGQGVRDLLIAWDTPAMEPNPDLRLVWLELECVFDDSDPVIALRGENYPQFSAKMAAQPYRVLDRIYCRENNDDDYPVVLQDCGPEGLKHCDLSHFPALNPDPVTPSLAGMAGVLTPGISFGIGGLERDGVDSQFPYLPLLSPSLNGVLYLDIYSIADVIYGDIPDELLAIDGGLGFKEATQLSMNAYIALLSKQLGPLLDLAP